MIPSDHLETMSTEIAVGVTKVDSKYANLDAEHDQTWDEIEIGHDLIVSRGHQVDIVAEVPLAYNSGT